MFSIKRERWGGLILKDEKGRIISRKPARFVSVSRNGKGRIVSWEKWSPKRPIPELKRIAKRQGGTFKKGVAREELVNVVEVVDTSKKPSKPRKGNYQYVVETIIKGKRITARSPQHDVSFPKLDARQEALERLYARIDQAVTGGYDEDEGMKIVESKKLVIKEGIVHYVRK